jgi:putative chitinase
MFSRETLRRLWPHCPPAIIDGIVSAAPIVFPKYGCEDPVVIGQAMAQFSHECGAGLELTENINYSATRAVAVWPSRFSSPADVYRKVGSFPGDPQFKIKLIDSVYGGRMGNRPGTHDGSTYIGRGGSQVTGHDGYAKLAEKTGLDLLGNPNLVNLPENFLECAVADFVLCGCLPYAKNDDIRNVTRRLNGGYIGLDQREQWLKRWKVALAADEGMPDVAAVVPPPPKPPGTLQFGDAGFEVAALQQQLSDRGYACGADDGAFHEATRDAVNAFKADNGMPTDGIADQATKDALAKAAPRPVSEARATATADDLRATGSRTVASADKLGLLGKLKMYAGGALVAGGGANQAGLLDLDTIQTGVDKAHQAYGILDSVKSLAEPLLVNPLVLPVGAGLAVLGFLVWKNAGAVIAARVDDHRSAANLGR